MNFSIEMAVFGGYNLIFRHSPVPSGGMLGVYLTGGQAYLLKKYLDPEG
jgi:hypothetical protein